MSRVRASLRRVPLPLGLLLGVAAVLSLSWSLATAPLQGPDESDHIAYVEHVAETGHIPSATAGEKSYADDEGGVLAAGFSRMYQNPLTRPPWTHAQELAVRAYEGHLPAGARKTGDGPNSVGKNPPLYYALAAVLWKLTPGGSFMAHLFVIRALGGVLLLLTVALSWLAAGEVFGRRMLPRTVATAVVALLPMDGFMSGIASTDVLLATIWAAFLWLALRLVRLGVSWQRAAGLSVVAVLSVLTHGRGLAILPPLVIVLVVAWLVARRPWRPTVAAIAGSGAALAIGFVAYRVVASASGGGASLYGGEVTLGPQSHFKIKQLLTSIWQFYLPRLDSTAARLGPDFGYRQFYVQQYFAGVFSSFEVYFPFWVYDFVQVGVALLALLGYTLVVLRWRAVTPHWPKIVVLVATAGSMIALLHVASYRALVNGSDNPLLVGRYLLALTPVFGIALAALVAGLPRRAGTVLAAVIATSLLALSFGGIALSVERFYA
jgi:hypothetical protein